MSEASPRGVVDSSSISGDDIFLFVNPKSGGNKGRIFLKVETRPLEVDVEGSKIRLHINSLLDGEPGKRPGFAQLKQVFAQTGKPVRAIVCGGDGTVMWVDSEASSQGIDTSRQMLFGVCPLGTGNDFSRFYGWGGRNPKSSLLDDDYEGLKVLARQWWRATVHPHDVWQVHTTVCPHSGIMKQVNKDYEEEEMELDDDNFTQPIINYFSIGQESQVGVEFDRNRTKYQTCNLAVYAACGIMEELSCSTQQRIDNLIHHVSEGTRDEDGRVVLNNDDDGLDESGEPLPKLVGSPEVLMFLNINSFSGGKCKPWSRDLKDGVEPPAGAAEVDIDNDPGDGRLEVLTLPNIVNIPLDKVIKSARRVYSGGPFTVTYYETEDDDLHVYYEVDGEFYHLINPVDTQLNRIKQLRVLRKHDSDAGTTSMKTLLKDGKQKLKRGARNVKAAGAGLCSSED
jgi:diacylglycerol kinase (ATP)